MQLSYFLFLLFLVSSIPVNVMMPLDTIDINGYIRNPSYVQEKFRKLKEGGVHGIMIDVWWGICERAGPRLYNFDGYVRLAQMAQDVGLKMEAVMSFHQCGGNVGDTCNITLPPWVFGQKQMGIFYKDQHGHEDYEYLSLGVDEKTFWGGRSPLKMYEDFMSAFAKAMKRFIPSVLTEIQVGLGPAGELRYPSYQLDRWTFPGIGAFQCYDQWMLTSLRHNAEERGHPEWMDPPKDAGDYNSKPEETLFFKDGYSSSYGEFFLDWYAEKLIEHGDDVLKAAKRAFKGLDLEIAGKVAGIHWWYLSDSHAAELTAGYYNTPSHQGYKKLMQMFASRDAMFDFTCFEMRDSEQPKSAECGPYELVGETLWNAKGTGVAYSAENALPRYDQVAYDTIKENAQRVLRIKAFTYLRLNPTLTDDESNWRRFVQFVSDMQAL